MSLYQSLESLANSIRTKKGITKKMTIEQMIEELKFPTLDRLYANAVVGTLSIPSGITTLYEACFGQFSQVTSFVLPNTITAIGDTCFWNCAALTEINIPTSVVSIGNSAFGLCSSLQSITIPSSVTSLGKTCFQGCSKLKSIRVERSTPPTAGANIFLNCPSDLKIYVPSSAVSAYQTATNWSAYATQIYGY